MAWCRPLYVCGDGTIAVACNFTNKSAMLTLPECPNLVLLVQLGCMYACAHGLNAAGLVAFPAFSTARFRQLLPLSLAYTAHASMVLRSLLYLNVAMYNTLKRTTPVMVLAFKAIAERKLPGASETACVAVIVAGCIIAGAGDLAYSASGYSAALLCAALQAVYLLLAEANERTHRSPSGGGREEVEMAGSGGSHAARALPVLPAEEQPLAPRLAEGPPTADSGGAASSWGGGGALASLSSAFEVLYYTSVTSLPLMALVAGGTGELGFLPGLPLFLTESFGGAQPATAWALTVAMGETVLAGSLVWCTECNSGLTTSIVGVLKGAVAVVLGSMFMAGPAKMTATSALGIAVVLAGGTWYSMLQWAKKR
ncbi:hypothetical protein FOA52_004888 [Chlamydomonas sp. UWO 241]|nr:hypothetical protein FOA52_004888 [Chlamydomonas sp. UWO 241]